MSKTRSELIRMIALNQAFNPMDLTSRPTTKQDEVLRDVWSRHKYVIAGNQSGKSQTKARDVAWKLTETHPYWSRPNSKRCMNKLCESNLNDAPDFSVVGEGTNALYSCNKCECKWMDWQAEPLTMLVGSKTGQLTQEMWDKKIRPYLEGVKIRIEKAGHAIKKVINVDEIVPATKTKYCSSRMIMQNKLLSGYKV